MNPNSQNQNWSQWTWIVEPGRTIMRSFPDVQTNMARFGRKIFGTASQMKIVFLGDRYQLDVITEGHPVEDPDYVQFIDEHWRTLFHKGFGPGTASTLTTKVLAGASRDPGKPREQWLMIGGDF